MLYKQLKPMLTRIECVEGIVIQSLKANAFYFMNRFPNSVFLLTLSSRPIHPNSFHIKINTAG